MAKKKNNLTLEEKLQNALLPEEEQPYQILGNWVWTRLGDIAYLFTGNSISSKVKESKYFGKSEGLSYIATKDISFDHQIDYNNGVRIDNYQNFRIATSNTPLLCIEGGSSGKKIGFVLEDICFGNKLCAFETQNLNSKLIYYYLQTDVFVNQFNNKRHGLIGGVSVKELNQISIPLPPLLEQHRIVEHIESLFSKLDEAKEKIQMSLDSFENRKSAILYKAFSGELTKKWREENGIKFKDWDKVELRERCHINPQKISTKELNDNMDITFIPMASVSGVFGEVSMPLIKKLGKYKKGYTNFEQGDVLFAKITPCMENGKIAVVGELENNIGFGSTEFYVFRCNENTYNRFIYHFLRWKKFREEARTVMSGAVGQQRVPKSFLEEYKISFPSIEEQKEIVRILDTIFDKEQDIQQLIDLIEKVYLMKKSILARAFRGELGTNLPEEESAIELLKSVLEV